MSSVDRTTRPHADTGNLIEVRDVPSLIGLLASSDPATRGDARKSLLAIGSDCIPLLSAALASPSARLRLGAIEAISDIRDPRSAESLVARIHDETHSEIRYAAILSLGEIGNPAMIPELVSLLQDPDKYARYGAALSLANLGWVPPDEPCRVRYQIALQEWDDVRARGSAAVGPLVATLPDPDRATRTRIVTLIGQIGAPEGGPACEGALRDRDPRVRWAAVLAAMNCGIQPARFPAFVAARERTGPDPVAAAILNFLFPGIGYNYIGKWWGFPVFMTYLCLLVLAQLAIGPLLPYLISYPITAVIGAHTYHLARRMSDL